MTILRAQAHGHQSAGTGDPRSSARRKRRNANTQGEHELSRSRFAVLDQSIKEGNITVCILWTEKDRQFEIDYLDLDEDTDNGRG